jgi:hypothetical protein
VESRTHSDVEPGILTHSSSMAAMEDGSELWRSMRIRIGSHSMVATSILQSSAQVTHLLKTQQLASNASGDRYLFVRISVLQRRAESQTYSLRTLAGFPD